MTVRSDADQRFRAIGLLIVAAFLAAFWGWVLFATGVVSAHHTTVLCARPGVWSIENSESLSASFTTNRGHTGSLGPDAKVEVAYSGTSLTVTAKWSNGVTATNYGQGDCRVPATTTTTSSSTTTTSTTTTTTEAPPSTTSSLPTTSVPDTSTSSAPPTSTPAPSTTPPAPTVTSPPSSVPSTPAVTPPVDSTLPPADCEQSSTFDPSDPDAGLCWQLVATL